MIRPTVPAGFARRLSDLTEFPGLRVELDEETTSERGRPVWDFTYTERGEPTYITSWEGQLDGNTDAICRRIQAVDFRRRDPKKYARELDDKIREKHASRERSRRTTMQGIASYSRRCLQAVANGEPSVGAR